MFASTHRSLCSSIHLKALQPRQQPPNWSWIEDNAGLCCFQDFQVALGLLVLRHQANIGPALPLTLAPMVYLHHEPLCLSYGQLDSNPQGPKVSTRACQGLALVRVCFRISLTRGARIKAGAGRVFPVEDVGGLYCVLYSRPGAVGELLMTVLCLANFGSGLVLRGAFRDARRRMYKGYL